MNYSYVNCHAKKTVCHAVFVHVREEKEHVLGFTVYFLLFFCGTTVCSLICMCIHVDFPFLFSCAWKVPHCHNRSAHFACSCAQKTPCTTASHAMLSAITANQRIPITMNPQPEEEEENETFGTSRDSDTSTRFPGNNEALRVRR